MATFSDGIPGIAHRGPIADMIDSEMAGVYAIHTDHRMLYVGQSGNLPCRLMDHLSGKTLLAWQMWNTLDIPVQIENCSVTIVAQDVINMIYPHLEPKQARRWFEAHIIREIGPEMNYQHNVGD